MTSSELEAMLPGDSCPECGDPVMDVESDGEEPVAIGKCCITCDWHEEFEPPPGPLEVTVEGNGDPEVFCAHYVRIACEHGTFRIKPGVHGLRISTEDGIMMLRMQASNSVWLTEE